MDRQNRGREEWPNFEPGSGTTGTGGGTPSGGGGDAPGTITRELQELGRQLAATARAAWQTEQRQEIQQEMTDGLRSLRDQLTETVDTLRQNPRAQTMSQSMKEQVGKAAETTRVTEIVDDVRTGLVFGLRELNDLLGRLSTRLERPAPDTAGGDAATGGSAVSSVGRAQTNPSNTQLTGGEYAVRAGEAPETAGTVIGAGLMDEEPGLAPESDLPVAGASQADLGRLGRSPSLPAEPEGPERRSDR